MFDMTYETALENAEHLKALGQTTIYLRSDEGFPYSRVTDVEEGSVWRLNIPTSCYLFVEQNGLRFKLSVDFEPHSESGTGTTNIDRIALRDLMLKLPPIGRAKLAEILEKKALPSLRELDAELRAALLRQADSLDCVRGVIALAREDA